MASITTIQPTDAPIERCEPNTPENACSLAPEFDAAREVERARELLAWVREHNRVAHLLRLARMQRTGGVPVSEACAKDCGSKVCDLYGCMLDRDAVPPVRHEEVRS